MILRHKIYPKNYVDLLHSIPCHRPKISIAFKTKLLHILPTQEMLLLDIEIRTPSKMESGKILSINLTSISKFCHIETHWCSSGVVALPSSLQKTLILQGILEISANNAVTHKEYLFHRPRPPETVFPQYSRKPPGRREKNVDAFENLWLLAVPTKAKHCPDIHNSLIDSRRSETPQRGSHTPLLYNLQFCCRGYSLAQSRQNIIKCYSELRKCD